MTDESGHNRDKRCEDAHHAIQAQMADFLRDASSDGVQQARAIHGLTQRQSASGQDNYGPQEVIEIFLSQDTRTEEEDNRNDRYYSHISEHALELMAEAPQDDCGNGYDRDEPLDAREFVPHWSNGHNGGVTAWLEGNE